MKTFSIKEVLKFGWEKTKDNYSRVFTVLLALLFLNFSMNFLNKAMHESTEIASYLLYGFTLLGFLVIEIVVVINIIKQGLVIVRGGEPDIKKILEYPNEFFNYIIGQILAGIVIVIGFILLIVPGIILALVLCFTKPILVDLKLGPIEALKKGRQMTKGHLSELFLFFLVTILMNIAGAIVFMLGLFITVPITFFGVLYLYNKFLTLPELSVNNPQS